MGTRLSKSTLVSHPLRVSLARLFSLSPATSKRLLRRLGEKSALGMCERLQTDPAQNANRVTRAVEDLPRDRLDYPSEKKSILLIFKSDSKIKFSEEPSLISFLRANLTSKF